MRKNQDCCGERERFRSRINLKKHCQLRDELMNARRVHRRTVMEKEQSKIDVLQHDNNTFKK